MAAPYPNFDGSQACTDPEHEIVAFLPTPDTDVSTAATCCDTCLFREPCRQYGLENDVQGVWGGLDDAQRRAYRRQHQLPEPPWISEVLDDLVLASRSARPSHIVMSA